MGDRPLRLYADCLATNGDEEVALGADAAQHARVWRLAEGAELELFDGAGVVAQAQLLKLSRSGLRCRIVQRTVHAPPTRRVHLLVGLTRGEKPDLVVRMATELGIASVRLVVCERSVARERSGSDRSARLALIARAACAQSGNPFLPHIESARSLAEVVNDLPAVGPAQLRIALHERATGPLPVPAPAVADIWALVGPEGGLAADEVALLAERDFVLANLRTPILRAETAALVAVARLTGFGPAIMTP